MSGFHWNDNCLKEALHTAADSLNPPDDLKKKIDARLAWQEKQEVSNMKKISMKKTAVAAAAAVLLTGTVCMAATKFSGYYIGSSSPLTEISAFEDIGKLEKKAGVKTDALEALNNGFVFEKANIIESSEMDAQGNSIGDSFHEVTITYKKGSQTVDYTIGEKETEYTEDELACGQMMESDGVSYLYSKSNYLFLPDESYELTAEEKEAEASGDLFVSYGSSEREKAVYESISWNSGGRSHILFGSDLNMGAEELLNMAKQM